MKTRKSIAILSLLFVTSALAGCGHQHSFESNWTSNSSQHWHRATCGCNIVDGLADHIDADNNKICDVCNRDLGTTPVPPPVHEHTLGSWLTDKDNHWKQCSECLEIVDKGAHVDHSGDGFCDTCNYQMSTPIPPDPDDYYHACEGLSGNQLSSKLKDINKAKRSSYDWSRYEAADEALDDSSSILCLYTRHNIKKDSHCGSYAWDKWNREHIFVQSKYSQSTSDNHNIFACEGQINNIRGDHKLGEVSHTSKNRQIVFGHQTDCYFDGSTFEPCDEAKGEVARAIMYGTVQYSYTMSGMLDLELALKWHLEHPNTQRDTKRNETVYKLQGNRNPFVDHPEYACKIWGTANATTRQLCGM